MRRVHSRSLRLFRFSSDPTRGLAACFDYLIASIAPYLTSKQRTDEDSMLQSGSFMELSQRALGNKCKSEIFEAPKKASCSVLIFAKVGA